MTSSAYSVMSSGSAVNCCCAVVTARRPNTVAAQPNATPSAATPATRPTAPAAACRTGRPAPRPRAAGPPRTGADLRAVLLALSPPVLAAEVRLPHA
ncbi:hypothetical protein ACFQX7_36585 [Luedemannella flava]